MCGNPPLKADNGPALCKVLQSFPGLQGGGGTAGLRGVRVAPRRRPPGEQLPGGAGEEPPHSDQVPYGSVQWTTTCWASASLCARRKANGVVIKVTR